MPSHVISDYIYFPDEQRLDIVFTSGRRYSYYGVPASLAEEMANAFSKGEFFNTRIKNRYFFRRDTGLAEARKA